MLVGDHGVRAELQKHIAVDRDGRVIAEVIPGDLDQILRALFAREGEPFMDPAREPGRDRQPLGLETIFEAELPRLGVASVLF